MAGNPPPEGLGDDFLEQILAVQPPGYGGGGEVMGSTSLPMMGLQLGSCAGNVGLLRSNANNNMGMMPLGLNLEHHGFLRQQQDDSGSSLDTNNSNNINNTPPSIKSARILVSSIFLSSLIAAVILFFFFCLNPLVNANLLFTLFFSLSILVVF